jgi:AcrR family transcriptional regulator
MRSNQSSEHKKQISPKRRGARRLLAREDWIAMARIELIDRGIDAVKVDRLARRLRVTRGSFYWHFKTRSQLLRDLLKSWEEINSAAFERALSRDGCEEFLAFVNVWFEEKDYSPAFDSAVRDWARTSPEAADAVRGTDERRINILHRIFTDMGYAETEALVRARITYFHQVGYYAMEIKDDPRRRRELFPMYVQVLLGTTGPVTVRPPETAQNSGRTGKPPF